jgi:hypothetical protein
MITDFANLLLVDDEIIINDREALDTVLLDKVLQFDAGARTTSVLDACLSGCAETARERAASAEHDVSHAQIGVGEAIR